jgi:hypothetical protein
MTKDLINVPGQDELQVYQVMARNASASKFFNNLNGEAGILSIMLMARELGLPPMQSIMGGMNIIQGKVEISPRMMNTMIRKAGHSLEITESTDKICKIKGIRNDTKEEYTATFSIEDASRAGLFRTGGAWDKYPSDMLFARCISRLARRLFADVISTAYVEGEISEEEKNEVNGSLEKSQELPITSPIPEPIEYITTEEVAEIEANLPPNDKEYRTNLLAFYSSKYGPITEFSSLPRKALPSLMKALLRRSKKSDQEFLSKNGELACNSQS